MAQTADGILANAVLAGVRAREDYISKLSTEEALILLRQYATSFYEKDRDLWALLRSIEKRLEAMIKSEAKP